MVKFHLKYKRWNRINAVCLEPAVQKLICPYRPWALKLCCQRSSDFSPPFRVMTTLVLLAVESWLLFAFFLYLLNRPSEEKAHFNTWEKLLVEVRKVNTGPMRKNVNWSPGLLAEETLVHRLKNIETQRGIALKYVAKRIGATDAIRNVTCWVQPGQLVTFLGPKGSVDMISGVRG